MQDVVLHPKVSNHCSALFLTVVFCCLLLASVVPDPISLICFGVIQLFMRISQLSKLLNNVQETLEKEFSGYWQQCCGT